MYRFDKCEVDERDERPQLVASEDKRPELLLGLRPDDAKVDKGKVNGVWAGPVFDGLEDVCDMWRVTAGHAKRARERAVEERVHCRTHSLV